MFSRFKRLATFSGLDLFISYFVVYRRRHLFMFFFTSLLSFLCSVLKFECVEIINKKKWINRIENINYLIDATPQRRKMSIDDQDEFVRGDKSLALLWESSWRKLHFTIVFYAFNQYYLSDIIIERFISIALLQQSVTVISLLYAECSLRNSFVILAVVYWTIGYAKERERGVRDFIFSLHLVQRAPCWWYVAIHLLLLVELPVYGTTITIG